MKRSLVVILAAGIAWIIGCSIVPKKFEAHITIDIRQHIEQEATNTLDFIEGKTDSLKEPAKSAQPEKTSWLREVQDALSPVTPVYAAELKSTSPEVARIAEELRKRNATVQALRGKGVAGENNRGYLEMRPSDQLKDPGERNEAQRLIAAENKDRKELYEEIAKLNRERKVSVSSVESVYAMEHLRRGKPGELFQLPRAGSDFDAFKASAAGQLLGADCVPGAWVTIK